MTDMNAATQITAVTATVTNLQPVWLSETAQGWHVHGTLTSVTGTENWGAAVDDVGSPLVGRWLDMTKGWASEEDKQVVLAAIEHAIIMSGAEDETVPVICMGLDAVRELDALQSGK